MGFGGKDDSLAIRYKVDKEEPSELCSSHESRFIKEFEQLYRQATTEGSIFSIFHRGEVLRGDLRPGKCLRR